MGFILASIGGIPLVFANGFQSVESHIASRNLGVASNLVEAIEINGFDGSASAYCNGEGVYGSSGNTLEACSEACMSSLSCRAFQFAPDASQFCMLYNHTTYPVPTTGNTACYVQTAPASRMLATLIGGASCSSTNDCAPLEVCNGGRCRRVNERVDVAMRCSNQTNEFNEPTVTVITESAIIASALAASPGQQPIVVSQSDFSQGFFDITQSGYYKFSQNVVIPWNNNRVSTVSPHQLGQTIGIRVTASDVVIDMNGHSLEADDNVNRFEQFVNLIQLNNNNFPTGALGFSALVSAHRVLIFSSVAQKGTLKKSTHFGISGIQNNDVIIRNLRMENVAVGGISLTDATGVHIDDVIIDNASLNSLWTQFFSAVTQLRRRVFQAVERVTANPGSSSIPLATWESNRVFVEGRLTDAAWAANPTPNRIMGNSFGIQVKNMINDKNNGAQEVKIENTIVRNIKVAPSEVVAIRDTRDAILMDADRNVFEWGHFFNNDGSVKVCAPSDTGCLDIRRINDIRMETMTYLCFQGVPALFCDAAVVPALSQSSSGTLRPQSGADIRGHSPKGAFGVRLVGITDAIVSDVEISDIDNAERLANDVDSVDNHYESPVLFRGKDQANKVFKGHMAFGIYGERCENIKLNSVNVLRVKSLHGSAIGVGFGDQSRHVIFHAVSSQVELPRALSPGETLRLPNLVPYGMPFYAEEDALSDMQYLDITSLGAFRTGEKHAGTIAVAPVVDCETNAAGSDFCGLVSTETSGPTECEILVCG